MKLLRHLLVALTAFGAPAAVAQTQTPFFARYGLQLPDNSLVMGVGTTAGKVASGPALAAEVQRALTAEGLLAPLISPSFTGMPTAPTPALGTNTTQIGTTAFATAAVAAEAAIARLAEQANATAVTTERTRALAAEALAFPAVSAGTAATRNLGSSVTDPGTGKLEALLPVQTFTATSHAFVSTDLYQETRRTNSGTAMSDTFPASSLLGLVNGTLIQLNNVDTTASLTITAGAGTTINGASTAVVGPGRSTKWVYDAPNANWRSTMNSLSGLLANQIGTATGPAAFNDSRITGALQANSPVATIGTSLYPQTSTSTSNHYDSTSNVLTNVVGAKLGLFGAASINGNTWVNAPPYVSGVDVPGNVTNYVISPNGKLASVSATRGSDNAAVSGSPQVIANTCVVADDNTTSGVQMQMWCRYEHNIIAPGSNMLGHLSDENSIRNMDTVSAQSDPFTPNPTHMSKNLRLDSGTGSGQSPSNTVTTAMDIINNGGMYRSGLIFGSNAFDTSLNSVPDAIAFAKLQAQTYYTAAATYAWKVYMDANSGYAIEGAGLVKVGPNGTNLLTLQGGAAPSVSTTAGDLTLGSATGFVNAPTINSPGVAPKGYVSALTLNATPVGVYGGTGASGAASGIYSFPSCSIAAPSNGAPATCSVGPWTVRSTPTIPAVGAGCTVNSVLTFVGGTFITAATLKITSVDGNGGVTGVTRVLDGQGNDGSYTAAPPAPVTTTGGGCTTNPTFTNIGYNPLGVTLLSGGNGYTSAPSVTLVGQTSPNAGNVSSSITATVSNTWTAVAAAGQMVLDNGGTELGTANQPTNVQGPFTVKGHSLVAGATPVLSSCGSSPAVSGSDNAGLITTGSGATACTLTFATAYVAEPYCTVTGESATVTYSKTKSAITISAGAGVKIDYQCIGQSGG
jgi:hypothetical protein